MPRNPPFGSFTFVVSFGSGEALGGFSEVSGLNPATNLSDYRTGSLAKNRGRKIRPIQPAGDVTLKRGVVDSRRFFAWLAETRERGVPAGRALTIILRDEKGTPVQRWTVQGALPLKWTGPALSGKGGGDVAMEELVLSCEGVSLV
jgi:phage tail-like protein